MRDVTDGLDIEQNYPLLDIESIKAIHRDSESYVNFVRKPQSPQLDKNGRPRIFENIGSIQVCELDALLPGIFENWLQTDSYMTLNGYFNPAPWTNPLTGLDDVWRKEKYLSRICSCYADIDCGRPDSRFPEQQMTWRDAMAHIGNQMDKGLLPQASIFARSGRGLYILWLLCDENDRYMPPKAWPENINLSKEINRAAIARLKEVAADVNAVDAARVLRLPGSYHAKAEQYVRYVVQIDRAMRPFLYTFSELTHFFDVESVQNSLPGSTRDNALPPQIRGIKDRGSVPARKEGFIALAAKRAQDISTLEAARGGIEQGFRRRTLTMYGGFLKSAEASTGELEKALKTMAANCRPPYPSDQDDPPLKDILRSVENSPPRRWNNQTLCKYFQIAPELARELNLLTIIPKEVAEERKQSPSKSRQKREDRQRCIQEIIESRNGLPQRGIRGVVKILSEQFGLEASFGTVRKDILLSCHAHLIKRPGRPKQNGGQHHLRLVGTVPNGRESSVRDHSEQSQTVELEGFGTVSMER